MHIVQMAEKLEPSREPLITLIARERPFTGVRPHMLTVRKLAAKLALTDLTSDRCFLAFARPATRSYPILMRCEQMFLELVQIVLIRTADIARVRAPFERIYFVLIANDTPTERFIVPCVVLLGNY